MDYKKILDKLRDRRRLGYGNELPGEWDHEFVKLAKFYLEAEDEHRQEIRNSVTDDMLMLLIGFSDRMAILAERKNDKIYLEYALIAHSIENFRYDLRENVFRMVLVHHVCGKLNCNSEHLFQSIASISSKSASKRFKEFSDRKPEMKTLKAMKIVEVQTEEGVDYTWGN